MTIAKQISIWGIVSLVLLVADRVVAECNLYLSDHHQKPLFSSATGFQLCFVLQLAAAVCGVVAIRRGSRWWLLTVVPAILLALGCYFGEL
jgi:hypothetical protein